MKNNLKKFYEVWSILFVLFISGCNNGNATNPGNNGNNGYNVGGTVSGLSTGEQLVLVNNNNLDDKVILTSSDSKFNFKSKVLYGGSYNVTILEQQKNTKMLKQSQNKVCTVNNYGGAGVNTDVTTINVVCSNDSFKISGNVVGLPINTAITIINNGDLTDKAIVLSDGTFSFPHMIARGGNYNITLAAQPLNEICTVNNGSAAGVNKDINNINIVCNKSSYPISGVVNGLISGQSLTLVNNGDIKNAITLSGNEPTSSFTLPLRVALNGNYNVTVATQPENQVCTVNNGSGIALQHNVTNINIQCGRGDFQIGGNVTGLKSGQSLTLVNNGDSKDAITLSGDSPVLPFTFAKKLPYNGAYNVKISTQPENEVCRVENRSGLVMSSDVNNIKVICTFEGYTVGGTVSGLTDLVFTTASVTIAIHTDHDYDSISTQSNGTFTLPLKLQSKEKYEIQAWGNNGVKASCSVVSGSSGEVTNENVTNVQVVCIPIAIGLL